MNIFKNAFTIDVEDYFQVESFSSTVDRNSWDSYESRVEANTYKILEILNNKNVTGTFFVLGWVAKRYPQIVEKISQAGHEVASHGMTHQLIYKQTFDQFKEETISSKKLLEDIIQRDVRGYRAATYSITKDSLWALDVLVEAGYEYDSSIFPMRHDRYGIPDACPYPHVLKTPNGSNIVEFPISTVKTKLFTLPIAGGGYFRLFPYWVTKYGLKSLNNKNQEFVFYLHPWEVDPEQPRIKTASRFSMFRHYNNLDKCTTRLNSLLEDFQFTSLESVLESRGLIKKH